MQPKFNHSSNYLSNVEGPSFTGNDEDHSEFLGLGAIFKGAGSVLKKIFSRKKGRKVKKGRKAKRGRLKIKGQKTEGRRLQRRMKRRT